ncbi:hypothetical protein FISHEDRAFT_48116 [Fistulina hepatica ATCC 64428]|uniref:FAD-binding PCMH-type domain-containing protein n=1 Tax=Fistulina hepatica ATCC 64428 TaxID=1128425 RepID=A0A0D7A836_9AGAR|nr:hypothetical protein FISHEDRAFT_48116 [Fistulina hepatica ATCC 64428]
MTTSLAIELTSLIRGEVYSDEHPSFSERCRIFNGNVVASPRLVACPLNAHDVSAIVKFCRKHHLSPSVKAGGFGTGGWAVKGDVVIDLSKIIGVDLESPGEDGSYTSIKDMLAPNDKGKGVIKPSTTNAVKRRREDLEVSDSLRPSYGSVRQYDDASAAVANFLHGPPLSPDLFLPAVRRRLDIEGNSSVPAALVPAEIDSGHQAEDILDPADGAGPLSSLPTPLHLEGAGVLRTPANGSPFGYLDNSANASAFSAPHIVQAPYPPGSTSGRWTGTSAVATTAAAPLGSLSMPGEAVATHPHVYVTFGSGMKQKDVDMYTASHPVPADPSTGDYIPYHVPMAAHPVGSSIAILGGFGFLSRLHGLSIDNLVEIEMVLADGTIVVADENNHPDLFWAVRGAGSIFGVATRYKMKAYPVPVVFAGNLIYRFHRATAGSLIRHFRDCIKGAPRELYADVLLTAGPAGKDSLVVIQMCYIGNRERGQEFLAAISSWDGERCLLNEVDEKSFLHQQNSVAQVLRAKAGRRWFIRSVLISSLPDDLINQTVMQFSDSPLGCTWLFELAGGALCDFETETCVSKEKREAAFTIAALHQWEMDVDDPRCKSSAEDWLFEMLKPVHTDGGGPLPCFLGRRESTARIQSCFGKNWGRLCEVKKKYDPDGVFKCNFWPLDGDGNEVDADYREPPSP